MTTNERIAAIATEFLLDCDWNPEHVETIKNDYLGGSEIPSDKAITMAVDAYCADLEEAAGNR